MNAYEIVVTCGSPKHKEPRKLHTYSYEPELHDWRWRDCGYQRDTDRKVVRLEAKASRKGQPILDLRALQSANRSPSSEWFVTSLKGPSHIEFDKCICGYKKPSWQAEIFYQILDGLRDKGLYEETAQSVDAEYKKLLKVLKQSTGNK